MRGLTGEQGALDAPALKGDSFQATWFGQPASSLLEYISTNMPQDRPGALKPEQYAQLLALILKENGVAAGPDNSPPIAADTLGKLKFATVVTDNDGTPFGIAADVFAGLQATNSSKQKLKLTAQDDPALLTTALAAQTFDTGDFEIRLA